MVNFVQHQEFATRFQDTVTPFQVFGNTCQERFPATLFRFPLRTEAQAAASRISNEVYQLTVRQAAVMIAHLDVIWLLGRLLCDGRCSMQVVTPETMLLHLASLEAEGHEALLFLKHLSKCQIPCVGFVQPTYMYTLAARVEMICSKFTIHGFAERMEVLEWRQSASQPTLRYACSVDDPSESCLASRSLFSRVPSAGREPISNIYQLQLLIERPLLDQKQHACYLISQQKGGA